MIRVVLVDDHDMVRMGIRRLLEEYPQVAIVGEAASGEDAVRQVRDLQPDVVLMDLKMPGIGGMEATRRIVAAVPESRVIILTAYEDDPLPGRLMQVGAAGYITKVAGIEEMVRAVETVARGERYIAPAIAQRMALTQFSAPDGSPLNSLSDREMQVAMMIVSCQKVQKISDMLSLSPKTVNTYRYRIFDKLGVTSDVELTHLALRHGLIDTDQPPTMTI